MLNKMIHSVQNARIAAIKKFSYGSYDILDEPGFLDDGYIKMKIQSLKEDYQKLDEQIQLLIHYDKKDDYNKQKTAVLLEQKQDTVIYMAFLASNSFNSLDFAMKLIEDLNVDFQLCLEALSSYKKKKNSLALSLFERYYANHEEPLEHFLINKVYGKLLVENVEYEKAAVYLRKAAEKRPEDTEVHSLLITVYEKAANEKQANVHRTILNMLGGS